MKHAFSYKCARRAVSNAARPVRTIKPASGGSGGGPEDGGQSRHFDGTYAISANQVQFTTRMPIPPAEDGPHVISLFSPGSGVDGRVEVNGSQGVRITAGPPMLPEAANEGVNGAEMIVGETQNITIQRGLIPGVDQSIEMVPGQITVDGGAGPVVIQSLTEVKLQCADGLSSITLTPAGIIIQGILVSIN